MQSFLEPWQNELSKTTKNFEAKTQEKFIFSSILFSKAGKFSLRKNR